MNSNTSLAIALAVALSLGSLLQCRPASEDTGNRGVAGNPDETISAFARLWAQRVNFYGGSRFLGVETLQNPTDAWVTQEIIHEVKPDFIVEAGTFKGGSALFWAMVLEEVNPVGRVITIDIRDYVTDAKDRALWKERIDFLVGSSTDPAIVDEVRRRVQGGRVLVILDSLHSPDHVYDELQMYSPLVSVGSYVIVQDTGLGSNRLAYELAAGGVRRFLKEGGGFEVDEGRERFMITNNPRGYLRRVR